MTNITICPNCNSTNTEAVHNEWYKVMVEEERQCLDCAIKYNVTYGFKGIIDGFMQ